MREHLLANLARVGHFAHHISQFCSNFARALATGVLGFASRRRVLGRRAVEVLSSGSVRESRLFELERENNPSQVLAAGGFRGDKPQQSKELIISVHIPKTGGTTFLDVLRASVEDALYLDYGPGIKPTGLYRDGKQVADQFAPTPDFENLSGRSVIHGHLHPAKYLARFPKATYVAWLRDPVERLASHYFFWQRTPYMEDPLCNKVITEKMTLEEFARMEVARNVQHRFLAPLGVEGFAFVGITEEYERSLELFRRLICPDVAVAPIVKNSNPNRSTNFYELEPGLRQTILKLNELDAYTYLDGIRSFRRLCDQVGI